MILFNQKYIESSPLALQQKQYVMGIRTNFELSQERLRQQLMAANASQQDIRANTGIGMLDFWQDVDRRLVSIRQNMKYAIVDDISGLAKPVSIGALSSVNLMAKDVSDDVTRSMDLQGKVTFDNLGSAYDKNPIPAFMAGAGMNYRTYMGQQDAQLGLFMESLERKTIKLMENIGDYMYEGDPKVVADGQEGEGIKGHRNTSKIDLGASGHNIDLTTATNDELVTYYIQTIGAIIDDNALGSIDVQWVSPAIYRRLQEPVGGTGEFKDGSMLEYLQKVSEVKSIKKDYSLSGNEYIMYKRDQQVICPLVALPFTSYQVVRNDPYANYNQKLICVMGLKVAKTYDDKYGVFYASEIS